MVSNPPRKQAPRKINRMERFRREKYLFLMLAPAVVCALIFSYVPMAGLYIGFVDYKLGFSIFEAEFVGLKHIIKFFTDMTGSTMRVLRNTICINLISMALNVVVPCAFALLLNELTSMRFKKSVQTITFFPYFLSPIIIYSITYNFFAVNSGVVNQLLKQMGLISEGINFLSDPAWAWPLIIGMGVWRSFGYNSVIYLAAIAGIEQEQYEVAEIDGAGRLARMLHITLPGVLPTVTVLMILNIGGLLGSDFGTMYIFTNTLNRDRMEVFSTYVYRMGIQKLNFSYATAAGLILSMVGLGLTLSANGISKKMSGRSIY